MYNFIDGDFFESLADYSFGDMYSPNMVNPSYEVLKSIFDKFEIPKIFIETHRIPLLFRELSNFPNQRCQIIAHNSDATFGEELLNHLPNNVQKIWCQNYNYIETDRIKSLPIGLERVRWFPKQRKQETLNEMISTDIDRTELVYMNFNPSTNPGRRKIYEDLKNKDFINVEMIGNGGNYVEYLKNLKKHKFIISPPGNGIDCHRNWEALYLGCIPIVLNSPFIKNIYSDSPVLIVDRYDLIESKNLIQYCDDLGNKQNNEEIYKSYWTNIYEKN